MHGEKIKIVIVLGPTCSGKTELAVRLAERCDGEIVNADSMQVYRGMEIGTAKPSPELLRRVPHHLIGIVDPDADFSASDFRREAARTIADIHRRGRRAFVVGGTGLYIKALLKGLVDSPSGAETIRQELQETARRLGSGELLRRLAEVDPETAGRLHPNDQVRIVRALEVYLQSGRPISRFRSEHDFAGDYYDCLKIGIAVERGELYRRIEERVERMMAEGFLEEVRGLLAHGFGAGLKSMRAIGYKELCAFLAGAYPLEEAVRLIKRDTRRYAKRQLTWFRQDDEINWVEYPARFDTICNHVIEFFS
ncbi:MAG: tRNA (adenosine(37)-N6)-dimethylallyltransferase MiaA [Geobacteraceae bacterium]|nr:tRNA (adenosine(37)-N6)-dimethylallyltransferase MiaA [Geobacteraceae bacterium]